MKPHVKIVLCAAMLPGLAQSHSACPEAINSVLINIPGYQVEPGSRQPKQVHAVERCMRRHPICLLLKDGKVVSGADEGHVRVMGESVVFAFVQHLRSSSRQYCASASLQPEIGGAAFWAYRTFTPNGGWIGEELEDGSTRAKTSSQVFDMLWKNFALFQVKMRERLTDGDHREEMYGYHAGELP